MKRKNSWSRSCWEAPAWNRCATADRPWQPYAVMSSRTLHLSCVTPADWSAMGLCRQLPTKGFGFCDQATALPPKPARKHLLSARSYSGLLPLCWTGDGCLACHLGLDH